MKIYSIEIISITGFYMTEDDIFLMIIRFLIGDRNWLATRARVIFFITYNFRSSFAKTIPGDNLPYSKMEPIYCYVRVPIGKNILNGTISLDG